jgi:hypothetical protein
MVAIQPSKQTTTTTGILATYRSYYFAPFQINMGARGCYLKSHIINTYTRGAIAIN